MADHINSVKRNKTLKRNESFLKVFFKDIILFVYYNIVNIICAMTEATIFSVKQVQMVFGKTKSPIICITFF